MARILAISSQVAHGSVGLSVMVPALQALGHEVIALPTVLLSNHPGHVQVAGMRVPPTTLTAMVAALGANGWLDGVDAVLSGYLPTPEHVAFVAATVAELRALRPGMPYLCDPVIGDWPKGVYIDLGAAAAIRDQLLPLASVLTPNAFELGWLTGQPVDSVAAAGAACRLLPGTALVVATSVPVGAERMANVVADCARVIGTIEVARRTDVPHGTGDLLAALVCGLALRSAGAPNFAAAVAPAVAPAVAEVERVIARSASAGHLRIDAAGPKNGGLLYLQFPHLEVKAAFGG
jgi:pyridoxine kinase